MIRTALVVAALTVGLATAEATTFNNEPVSVPTTQTTTAQASTDKCKPKPKTKRKWRPKKKKACPKPDIYILQPCLCRGQQGPIGPRGLPGKVIYKGPNLSLGYMGMALWPKNTYAWSHGPSLRLSSPLSETKELAIELGWAIGRDRAVMGQVTVTHWFEDHDWVGFTGGLFGQVIGLRASRDTGYYGGVTPQASVRATWESLDFRASAGLAVGAAGFDNSHTDIVAGPIGSAGISYRW